ncbi:cysteine synthase family protein [Pseudomonas protegens]|uniref:PLP-dependent cysteine synthase family protein n=1 Tax=Pseudomonas protegens TaxID=380021 RepID=UPI001C8D30FE|nr:cysteine synthase family protein [Pseudomonas protegens]QZI70546.1 cysteine synthase family protein [Pseudomonas protegens]WOE79816.1 cysteine synthase family protein [Pseudomonas protegens]
MHSRQPDSAIKHQVSDLIGASPLLQLCETANGSQVLLKLEQFNPTGTAKIRMARQMIDEAEAQGLLQPGGWIVESTSGNTGLGLALIAAERGYRFTAVVDHHSSAEKLRGMQAFGAQLVRVGCPEGGLATADRDATAERIAREQGAYWTQQHHNPANANGYRALAEELHDVLGERLDYLFGAVGTGGSLCGTARALKAYHQQLQVVGVEPAGSVIFGGPGGPYLQSGTGTPEGAEIGALIDYPLIDRGLKVTDAEAFETARYLARQHGLLVGGSAGGVIYHALRQAQDCPAQSVIVALVCDGGEKYLDTVFNDEWMDHHQLFDPEVRQHLACWLAEA